MALFATDAEVKAALRLSGMPASADGEDQFQKAVLRASVAFRKALGTTAVAIVAGGGQLAIDRAKLIECDLIYCELLYTMPYASLDGSASMDKWYNQEAPFRHLDDKERNNLRMEICARGKSDLAELAGDLGVVVTVVEGEIQCFIIGGTDEDDGSCRTSLQRGWGWSRCC